MNDFDLQLVERLRQRARGYIQRMKIEAIAPMMGLAGWVHGNNVDVQVRHSISYLVDEEGAPIASEPGPTGGVWWITTEWERYAAITMLRSQVRSIERRADKLSVAPLDWTPPQARLF